MTATRELSFATAETGVLLGLGLAEIIHRIEDVRCKALALSMSSDLTQSERARIGVKVYQLYAMGARAEQIQQGLAGLLAEAEASASLADLKITETTWTEGEPCPT